MIFIIILCMSIKKPFHRNHRKIKDGFNSGYSNWGYIMDEDYAENPEHYTRAYLLILKDLKSLFEYIEPADENLHTYSFRIHELLMRASIETEANFKAILKENIFNPKDKNGRPKPEKNWGMKDYQIINKTHHLDDYRVKIPIWQGDKNTFRPFHEWKSGQRIEWYNTYNETKHDRLSRFKTATFEAMLNSVAGLIVLLTAQFRDQSFEPGPTPITSTGYGYYKGEYDLGNFFCH
jgi:hypothetical protein